MEEMKRDIGFLFDLDGVLIDSEREYTRIWNHINDCFPTGKVNFAKSIKGCTLTSILESNYPDAAVREQVVRLLYEEEGKMAYDYCPHAEEFLSQLDRDGIPHALVTSSDSYKMGRLYADLPRFKRHFEVIIDSSRVERSKPDPQGYLLAAESLNINPLRCAVFEDSVQGVKAGRSAGCYVVGIAGTVDASMLAPWCDIVVDGLDELSIEKISAILCSRG